jgi:hypothetical protein
VKTPNCKNKMEATFLSVKSLVCTVSLIFYAV